MTNCIECAACGICIGAGYIETMPNQVGGYSICGWVMKMQARGKIEIQRTAGNFITYLLLDGETVEQKENIKMVLNE